MAASYILAIDQGTTSTRAVIYDSSGHVRGSTRPRADAALPPSRLGRARRRRHLAVGRRGRAGSAGGGRPSRPATSPPSASPTSARPRSCGTARAASRSPAPSSGRIAAPPIFAANARPTRNRSGGRPAWSSIPISPPPKSTGCCSRTRRGERGPRPAGWRAAPSIASSSGGSPAAGFMPPIAPTPRGHCCSTCAAPPGMTSCAAISRCRAPCSPTFAPAPRILA